MRLYIDHDVARQTAIALRLLGHDVVTSRESGAEQDPDHLQMLRAAGQARALVTHNRKDFMLLQGAWLRWSLAWNVTALHFGILVLPHAPPLEAAGWINDFLISQRADITSQLHTYSRGHGWQRIDL